MSILSTLLYGVKTMPAKISPDFKPDERSYTNLRKHGAIPEFVDWELENFIVYFTDTGGKKKSWQMALQRWMRTAWKGSAGRAWEREREFESSNRPYRKQPADIFQLTLGDMIAEGLPKPGKRRMIPRQCNSCGGFDGPGHKCPRIEPGPAMSPEDAFAELKKMRIIR